MLVKRAQHAQVDHLIRVVVSQALATPAHYYVLKACKSFFEEIQTIISRCDRFQLYANHYKARDEFYMLSFLLAAITDEMAAVTTPTSLLANVRQK